MQGSRFRNSGSAAPGDDCELFSVTNSLPAYQSERNFRHRVYRLTTDRTPCKRLFRRIRSRKLLKKTVSMIMVIHSGHPVHSLLPPQSLRKKHATIQKKIAQGNRLLNGHDKNVMISGEFRTNFIILARVLYYGHKYPVKQDQFRTQCYFPVTSWASLSPIPHLCLTERECVGRGASARAVTTQERCNESSGENHFAIFIREPVSRAGPPGRFMLTQYY